jgi:hypothetical protein
MEKHGSGNAPGKEQEKVPTETFSFDIYVSQAVHGLVICKG